MFHVALSTPTMRSGFGTDHESLEVAIAYIFKFCREYAQKFDDSGALLDIVHRCADIDVLIVAMDEYVGIDVYEVEEK